VELHACYYGHSVFGLGDFPVSLREAGDSKAMSHEINIAEVLCSAGEGVAAPAKRCPGEVMNWFTTNRQSLKRLVFVIEPTTSPGGLALKRLKFHGSNDFPE
jgi:hypothetical protein